MDHGDEGGGVSVSASPCPGGLEEDWLALAVVKLLKLRAPWVLCLDRTNWKIGRRDVNILMLAIATQRLRIPLSSHCPDDLVN